MKTIRQTPQCLNDSLDILGVQRIIFMGGLLLSAFLCNWLSLYAGLGGFLVLVVLSQIATKKDRDWLQILTPCFRFQMARAYDPIEREYFQLEITEDGNEEED
jgi:hypothetical protein